MRIIAGSYRGRKIAAPPGHTTRPTTDRVRESLFSILGNISGATVWDVFAGSGALGLEALSRNADFCLFTDTHRQAITTILANIDALSLQSRTQVLRRSYAQAIRSLAIAPDLIFVDPPYDSNLYNDVLTKIATSDLIPHDALIVVEHRPHRVLPPNDIPSLTLHDSRTYGSTTLSFLYKS